MLVYLPQCSCVKEEGNSLLEHPWSVNFTLLETRPEASQIRSSCTTKCIHTSLYHHPVEIPRSDIYIRQCNTACFVSAAVENLGEPKARREVVFRKEKMEAYRHKLARSLLASAFSQHALSPHTQIQYALYDVLLRCEVGDLTKAVTRVTPLEQGSPATSTRRSARDDDEPSGIIICGQHSGEPQRAQRASVRTGQLVASEWNSI